MSLDFNNQEWTYRKSRLKYFNRFVEHKTGNILVGGLGEFEKALAPDAKFTAIHKDSDYNYSGWTATVPDWDKYDVVYCFEVLEHLLNPLNFLENIVLVTNDSLTLYVSFPTGRPMFLWTDGHFHEFQMKRAEKMFEMAGFGIVKKTKTGIIWKKWYEYLTGFRPFLRLFFPLRCAIYQLEKI